MSAGRPSIYSIEIGRELCLRLMLGRSLAKITEDEDMPSEATVYSWLSDGSAGIEPFDEFLERYTSARAIQAEKHLDGCVDISDDSGADWRKDQDGNPVLNTEAVQRARLRVETRLKVIEKLAPKKYGSKIQQEITGKDGTPLAPSAVSVTVTSDLVKSVVQQVRDEF